MSGKHHRLCATRGIPHPHGAVTACRGDAPAVRTVCHRPDPVRVAREHGQFDVTRGIPHPHGAITACRGDAPAVRTVCHRPDPVRVAREHGQFDATRNMPHPHRPIPATGSQVPAVRAVYCRKGASLQRRHQSGARGVPYPHGSVHRGDLGTVRAEHQRADAALVPVKDCQHLSGVGIPQPYRAVVTSGCDASPIRAVRQRTNQTVMSELGYQSSEDRIGFAL